MCVPGRRIFRVLDLNVNVCRDLRNMDKTTSAFGVLFLAIVPFIVETAGQKLQIALVNTPDHLYVVPKSEFKLNCSLNKGLTVILEYKVQFMHKSLVNTSSPVEKQLTEQQALLSDAHPDFYKIEFSYDQAQTFAVLTVKNVQPGMDGLFICRAKNIRDPTSVLNAPVDVVVYNDVQSLVMHVEEESITDEATVPIQIKQGEYDVSCTAKGFNDDAVIELALDGVTIESVTEARVLDPEASTTAKARRYTQTISVTPLKLRRSNQRISCRAKAKFNEANYVTVRAPLIVTFEEPLVECQKNVSAIPGELYVKLECIVHHKKVPVEKYTWTIGSTGEVISAGTHTKAFDEVKIEEMDGDKTKVTLDLYKAEEWHFKSEYYLDIHIADREEGPIRESVMLIRLDPTGAASGLSSAALAVFSLCALFSLLVGL